MTAPAHRTTFARVQGQGFISNNPVSPSGCCSCLPCTCFRGKIIRHWSQVPLSIASLVKVAGTIFFAVGPEVSTTLQSIKVTCYVVAGLAGAATIIDCIGCFVIRDLAPEKELEDNVNRLDEENNELEDATAAGEKQLADLKKQIAELTASREAVDAENKELQQQIETMNTKLDTALKQIADYVTRIEDLKAQAAKLSAIVDNFGAFAGHLKDQLKTLTKEDSTLGDKLTEMRKKRDAALKLPADIEKGLKGLDDTDKKMLKNLNELAAAGIILSKAKKDLETDLAALKAENEQLKVQTANLDQVEDKLRAATERYNALVQQTTPLFERYAQLSTQLQPTLSSSSTIENQLAELSRLLKEHEALERK